MGGSKQPQFLPWWVRDIPADLSVTILLVGLTDIVVLFPVINETPLRILFGLPMVLFLPGYAFIAALFPEHGDGPVVDGEQDEGVAGRRFRGIDGIERVALSFGLSIAIVPLIGLVLNFTPWGIRLVPILLSISGLTVIFAGIAAVRRWELPADERFSVPYTEWIAAGRAELFHPESRTDTALNVLLVASVLLAVSSVAYAVSVPKSGESFTEFYLLTERDDGELVATDYPTDFVLGEGRTVVIGIGNQEHKPIEYVVVNKLQQVRVVNNSTTVLDETELDRFRVTVGHNETWQEPYSVRPSFTGSRLRLAFLLYKGAAPDNPTIDNAYRQLHLWVNVSQ